MGCLGMKPNDNNKYSMKKKLIDFLIQQDLEETKTFEQQAEAILNLFNVVGQSEQLVCDCGNPNLTWYGNGDDKTYFCFECKKEVTN